MEPAHFHCQYKKFTRAKGQSAVQAAAYRLAASLSDERTGLSHNYTRKQGVSEVLTFAPAGKDSPGWVHDPVRLWNEVEAAEKTNPRALVMHEWEIALPHQLDAAQRREAAREMAQFIADRYGCVAMAAFHDPSRNGDQRNHHLHLMFTPRAIGPEGFVRNKFRNYSLRAPEADMNRMMTGAEEIVFIKSQWAAIGNRHLERAGFSPTLDHRSYADQGIDLEPQKHLGPDATAKERRGERTAKGDFNRAVRDRNKNRREWARAWEESRIDITGSALPQPPPHPPKPAVIDENVDSPERTTAPQQEFSPAFLSLMENQKEERRSIIQLHVTEQKKVWQDIQEKRGAHKSEWAELYRQQRQDRDALEARFSGWRQAVLRKLDITGRLKKKHRRALEDLERRQSIERARLGRIQRALLRDHAERMRDKHVHELMEADTRHIQQRREFIAREERNREIIAQAQARRRSRDRDQGRGR